MAAARTGRHPHAGSAGTGERCWPPAESVLSKPQSSPTVLLVLLVPFLPQACFLSPQRHCVILRRGRCEKSEGWATAWAWSEGQGLQRN